MSWLSDLANKAEAFLEKVDQTAASSLSTENQPQSQENPSTFQDSTVPNSLPATVPKFETTTNISSYVKKPGTQTSNLVRPVSVPNLSQTVQTVNGSKKPPVGKKKNTDDPLFEFLNDKSIPAKGTRRQLLPKTSTPIKSHHNAIQKEGAAHIQIEDQQKVKQNDEPSILVADQKIDNMNPVMDIPSAIEPVIPNSADTTVVSEELKEDIISTIQSPVPMKNIASERLSNLELENKLLKGEMASLNEELARSLRKSKELQEELVKTKNDFSHMKETFELKAKDVNLLLDNEKDYKESMKAKDSQLAVLRVRIQEVDEELKAKTEMLEKLQNEKDRVLRDHSESTGIQSIALSNIKQKMEEAEGNLRKEKEEHDKTMHELVELRSKIQTDQQEMALSVKQLQAKLNEEKGKVRELEQQSKSASGNAETAQKELKDYRDKATRILQAKEKLIMSLKQGHSGTDSSPLIQTELEDLRQERDLLREDLQQARYKLEQIRADMQELERQHQSESDEQNTEIEGLRQSLQEEEKRRQHLEDDSYRLQQDLRVLREDLQRQKKYTVEQLQEREDEIRHLRNQIAIKSTTSASQEELENRVRSLTESLIQKQTLVETLSTEKSSLTLQLERLEQQYNDVHQSLLKRPQNFRTTGNNFNDIDDLEEGNRLQSIASIMPNRITRSKHWKSTVNEIDKFSIRLGLFLRRYPIARLFVILYMFILHLWVTVVLLTYKPEIHNEGPPGAAKPMPDMS